MGKATSCRGQKGPCAERLGRGSARPRAQNRNHRPAPVPQPPRLQEGLAPRPSLAHVHGSCCGTTPASLSTEVTSHGTAPAAAKGPATACPKRPDTSAARPGPLRKDTGLPSTLGQHPVLPILVLLFQRDKGISGAHLHQETLINSSHVLQAMAQEVTHVSWWAEDSEVQSSPGAARARQGQLPVVLRCHAARPGPALLTMQTPEPGDGRRDDRRDAPTTLSAGPRSTVLCTNTRPHQPIHIIHFMCILHINKWGKKEP